MRQYPPYNAALSIFLPTNAARGAVCPGISVRYGTALGHRISTRNPNAAEQIAATLDEFRPIHAWTFRSILFGLPAASAYRRAFKSLRDRLRVYHIIRPAKNPLLPHSMLHRILPSQVSAARPLC